MIGKYSDLNDKGKELLKLIEHDVNRSRLHDVIEFEVDLQLNFFKKNSLKRLMLLILKMKLLSKR